MSVKFSLVVCGEGDSEQVASVEWEAIPRVGERVVLSGPQFGNGGEMDDGVECFIVECVNYTDTVTEKGKQHYPLTEQIEVYLRVEHVSGFVPLCTCRLEPGQAKSQKPNATDSTICDNCNGRLAYRNWYKFQKQTAG
jgi:hypothetical protein